MILFIALLFGLGVVIFSVQNVVPVEVRFMGWSFHSFLSHVALVATAAGALFALILTLSRTVRGSFKVWEAQGKMRRLQSELKAAQENARHLQEQLDQQAAAGKAGPPGGETVAR